MMELANTCTPRPRVRQSTLYMQAINFISLMSDYGSFVQMCTASFNFVTGYSLWLFMQRAAFILTLFAGLHYACTCMLTL